MSKMKKKLFWEKEQNHKRVFFVSWDEPNDEYYTFIKKQIDKGYHQIALDSIMMLDFISFYAERQNWSLEKIEMMEEDEDLDDELVSIISKLKTNKGYYALLINRLREVIEENTSEIRRVYWEYESQGEFVKVFLQGNGILGITVDDSSTTKNIITYVEEKINR